MVLRALVLACLAGCSSSGTEMMVTITRDADVMLSQLSIVVTVPDRQTQQRTFRSGFPLTGTLLLHGLPDRAVEVRVELTATETGGRQWSFDERKLLVPKQRVSLALHIGDDGPDLAAVMDLSGDLRGDLAVEPRDLSGAPVDGAMGDGSDGAVVGCAHLLCDDFESGLDAQRWLKVEDNGTVARDSLQAHSGSFAVHQQLAVSGFGLAKIALNAAALAVPDHLFVRMFVYVPSSTPVQEVNLALLSQSATGNGVSVWLWTDRRYGLKSSGIGNDTATDSTGTLPLGQWACVEMEVDAVHPDAGVAGGARLYDSSGEVPGGTAIAPVHPDPRLDRLELGLRVDAPSAIHDLWIDDVVLSDRRIGCN